MVYEIIPKYNWVGFHPLYNPTNQGFFHCSGDVTGIALLDFFKIRNSLCLQPPKTNMTMDNSNHLKIYLLFKMVISIAMLVYWRVVVN